MSEKIVRTYDSSPDELLGTIREAVELWYGEWSALDAERTAEIRFPVQAGLRRSMARGLLRVEPAETGSRLVLELEPVTWQLHGPAVALLVPAAAAAVAVVLWPFFPVLGPLVPLGLVTALGAWFLVVTRLQNRGPEELLETVEAIRESHPES